MQGQAVDALSQLAVCYLLTLIGDRNAVGICGSEFIEFIPQRLIRPNAFLPLLFNEFFRKRNKAFQHLPSSSKKNFY